MENNYFNDITADESLEIDAGAFAFVRPPQGPLEPIMPMYGIVTRPPQMGIIPMYGIMLPPLRF